MKIKHVSTCCNQRQSKSPLNSWIESYLGLSMYFVVWIFPTLIILFYFRGSSSTILMHSISIFTHTIIEPDSDHSLKSLTSVSPFDLEQSALASCSKSLY